MVFLEIKVLINTQVQWEYHGLKKLVKISSLEWLQVSTFPLDTLEQKIERIEIIWPMKRFRVFDGIKLLDLSLRKPWQTEIATRTTNLLTLRLMFGCQSGPCQFQTEQRHNDRKGSGWEVLGCGPKIG